MFSIIQAEEEKHFVCTDSVTGIEFVLVKGDCFDMGGIFGDGYDDVNPVHEVCVDDFCIGKYEVTQGQWEDVMGSNPSVLKKGRNHPVESISWNDVQEFITKLNQKAGQNYRLPSEAEWEYAARSGGKREKWAGTSNESELESYAWYNRSWEEGHKLVGQKMPNGLGIYDMSGNVWEWCSDWYHKEYYKISPGCNPKGPSNGSRRVRLGGSWPNEPKNFRTFRRASTPPDYSDKDIGFRLVKVL